MQIIIERPSSDGLTQEMYEFSLREEGPWARETLRLRFDRYAQYVRHSRRHKLKAASAWDRSADVMHHLPYTVQKLERPEIPESVKTEVELRIREAIKWVE